MNFGRELIDLRKGFKDESLMEKGGIDLLFGGGLEEVCKNREDLCAFEGTISEADFSEDDAWAESSFGKIVGGINPGRLHKGEPGVLFLDQVFSGNSLVQRERSLIGTGL